MCHAVPSFKFRPWLGAILLAVAGCATPGPAPTAALPDNPAGLVAHGHAALETGDNQRAIGAFTRAAAHGAATPAHRVSAWSNLGVAQSRDGNWGGAAESFQNALALEDEKPGVHFNLGVARRHLGQLKAAEESYLRALELAPDHGEARYNLGILYEIYLNRPNDALAAYHRYLEGDHPHAERVRGWIKAIERQQEKGTSP